MSNETIVRIEFFEDNDDQYNFSDISVYAFSDNYYSYSEANRQGAIIDLSDGYQGYSTARDIVNMISKINKVSGNELTIVFGIKL